ncbi:uncharacterized protein LOC135121961 [Zophobas morio]|uniref:uncharacterized protein LOC135121961 n=1 Tax=Zophobas morio TaxID=2755281 RepID=UPI003083D9BC
MSAGSQSCSSEPFSSIRETYSSCEAFLSAEESSSSSGEWNSSSEDPLNSEHSEDIEDVLEDTKSNIFLEKPVDATLGDEGKNNIELANVGYGKNESRAERALRRLGGASTAWETEAEIPRALSEVEILKREERAKKRKLKAKEQDKILLQETISALLNSNREDKTDYESEIEIKKELSVDDDKFITSQIINKNGSRQTPGSH